MTKYVVNSGGLRNNPDGAKRFVAEYCDKTVPICALKEGEFEVFNGS